MIGGIIAFVVVAFLLGLISGLRLSVWIAVKCGMISKETYLQWLKSYRRDL